MISEEEEQRKKNKYVVCMFACTENIDEMQMISVVKKVLA